ncbi:MAG: GTP 3',8-cyclase MoaA [Gammaproteobacteria bacterium]|jgi:cyclic pyranopterin phosphate synthase
MFELADSFGRRFRYLRLSVTRACNFRCEYCLPQGYQADGGPAFLAVPEIERLARAFAELGIRKIRLTGGEPTVRRDLPQIAERIRALPGIETLALTTNGYRLDRDAARLRAAGIQRLNISLDALDRQSFRRVTGVDRFDRVMAGIERALAEGFESVKLNVVMLREHNLDQLPAFLDLIRERPIGVRFIELMRTRDNAGYFSRMHVGANTLREQLLQMGFAATGRSREAGPSVDYRHPDYRGHIGLIAPYSPGFCDGCNRLRVTARGELRLCLFGERDYSLRKWLQQDSDLEPLKREIVGLLSYKPASHLLHEGRVGSATNLAAFGG